MMVMVATVMTMVALTMMKAYHKDSERTDIFRPLPNYNEIPIWRVALIIQITEQLITFIEQIRWKQAEPMTREICIILVLFLNCLEINTV